MDSEMLTVVTIMISQDTVEYFGPSQDRLSFYHIDLGVTYESIPCPACIFVYWQVLGVRQLLF